MSIKRIYELYKLDPSYVSKLSVLTLETIDKSLFRRRLKGTEAQYRDDIRAEIANRQHQERIEKKAKDILLDLSVMFCAKEVLWKNIRDGKPGMANRKLKKYGRMIGLAVNDMSNIPTNIWTMSALLNLVNGNTKFNTDEHFYSLYANAGPDMFYDALAKDIDFNIHDLGRLVYKYNQTIKSTVQENNDLGVYHRSHAMVDPQTSYEACSIDQLVLFEQKPTIIKEAWHHLFREEWYMDPNEIQPPFSNIMTLEEAAILHPELKKLLPEKDSINTFYDR